VQRVHFDWVLLLMFNLLIFKIQTVHVDSISGAPTTLFVLETDRGLTWEVCLQLISLLYFLTIICMLIEAWLTRFFSVHISFNAAERLLYFLEKIYQISFAICPRTFRYHVTSMFAVFQVQC
jgi:hypothetical protein